MASSSRRSNVTSGKSIDRARKASAVVASGSSKTIAPITEASTTLFGIAFGANNLERLSRGLESGRQHDPMDLLRAESSLLQRFLENDEKLPLQRTMIVFGACAKSFDQGLRNVLYRQADCQRVS